MCIYVSMYFWVNIALSYIAQFFRKPEAKVTITT